MAITAAASPVLAAGAEAALDRIGRARTRRAGRGVAARRLRDDARDRRRAGAWLVARGLKRRRTSARLAALVLAVANLIIVPFGTALGVYTFWVLLNDDARREFGRPPRGPSAGAILAG